MVEDRHRRGVSVAAVVVPVEDKGNGCLGIVGVVMAVSTDVSSSSLDVVVEWVGCNRRRERR